MNYLDILRARANYSQTDIGLPETPLEKEDKIKPKNVIKRYKVKTDIGKDGLDMEKHNEMLKMLETMPKEVQLRIKMMSEQKRNLDSGPFKKDMKTNDARNTNQEALRSNYIMKNRAKLKADKKTQDVKDKNEAKRVQTIHNNKVIADSNRNEKQELNESNQIMKERKIAEAKLKADTKRDVAFRNENIKKQNKATSEFNKKEKARVTKENKRIKVFNEQQLKMAKTLDEFKTERNLVNLKVAQVKQSWLIKNAKLDQTTGDYTPASYAQADQQGEWITREYELKRTAKLRKAFIQAMSDHRGDVDAVMAMFESNGLKEEVLLIRGKKPTP